MDNTVSEEPRFDEEELKEIARLQSDPTSEHYYNDPDETFMSKVKRKLEPYGEEFKGFIEYLFSPSKHFGTGQYNEGGMADQTEKAFGGAFSRRPGFRSLEEAKGQVSQEELMAGVENAASFLIPFYDSGVNVSNVLEEYMKPEGERDYKYIESQFTEAGQSAALEAGLILMGGVVGKYGAKGVKALSDKIKQYEIDPSAMSAFGVGAIRKKDTFEEVMTPVKVTKKGTKKTGESILRPSSDLAKDLDPRLKRAMSAETAGSVMPGPGKFFDPSKKGYKGDKFVGMLKDADIELDLEFGNYIMMGKGKPQDVSNETFENLFVSARPSEKKTSTSKAFNIKEQRKIKTGESNPNVQNKAVARANLYDGPSLSIADMKANYKAATGKTGVEVRTNLLQPEQFKMVTDAGERSLDHPIVAVQNMSGSKDHFYTLDTQFVGPVRMDRLTGKVNRKNKKTGEITQEVPQPNLRPATVGDIEVGEQVGTIRIYTKKTEKNPKGYNDHPLYAYIEVDATKAAPEGMGSIPKFNKGGEVMNMQKQMSLFEYGGIADDGMKKDPVSGNDIPPGSLASEVRDDIPAMLSEGEYVVPADVLRYYGVNFFEGLRNKAKQGLSSMEQNGRIGGEPLTPQQIQQNMSGAPQAGAPAPMPVQANAGVLTMPKEYTQQAQILGGGGFNPADWATVGGSTFNQTSQQDSVTTFKTFVNADTNQSKVLEYINGKLKNPADEQYTVPPYYEFGSAALKKAQQATQQPTGGDDDGPTPSPTTPTSGNEFEQWGQDVDWTNPLAYAETLDVSKMEKLGGIGTALAGAALGPAGMVGVGLAQTGMGLQKISDLRAAAIIARAQGMEKQAKQIDDAVKDYIAQSNEAVQFLEDIVADGNKKAETTMNRLGLLFDKDKKGNFIFKNTEENKKQTAEAVRARELDRDREDDPDIVSSTTEFDDSGTSTTTTVYDPETTAGTLDPGLTTADEDGLNKGGLMTKAKKKK